jgi:hypothetical protein
MTNQSRDSSLRSITYANLLRKGGTVRVKYFYLFQGRSILGEVDLKVNCTTSPQANRILRELKPVS